MLAAGCRLKAFYAPEDDLAAAFAEAYPQARRVADEREILDDPAMLMVVGAGIPGDRAAMALRAMRAGKDVMVDKPGCTTLEQLDDLKRAQADTGRIWSICYSEHFLQKATVAASRLVAEGAIGRVVNTIGLGPHRIGLQPAARLVLGHRARAGRSSSTSPRTSSSSSCTSPARRRRASCRASRRTSTIPSARGGATTGTRWWPRTTPRASSAWTG